jgi:hypothetical protein
MRIAGAFYFASLLGNSVSFDDTLFVIAVATEKLPKFVALLHFLPNVKEHATLSARASVDHWVEVKATEDHENRAADRGCASRLVRLIGFITRMGHA